MPSRKITLSLATHHTRKTGKSNSWHEDHGEKRTAKIAAKRQRAIDQYGGNAGGMVSVSPQKVMQATLFATAAFLAFTPNAQAVNVRQGRRDGSQVATPEGKWHGNKSEYGENLLRAQNTSYAAQTRPTLAKKNRLAISPPTLTHDSTGSVWQIDNPVNDSIRSMRQVRDTAHHATHSINTQTVATTYAERMPGHTSIAPTTNTSLPALHTSRAPTIATQKMSFVDIENALTAKLPDIFVLHVKKGQPSHADIQNTTSALTAYLQKPERNAHATLFEHDTALIDGIADALGLAPPLALRMAYLRHPTTTDSPIPPYAKALMRTLVSHLTAEIDFSTVHPKAAAITYDGHCFRGVNHGYDLHKTLAEARHQIKHFLRLKTQAHFNINTAQANRLARLLLPPELMSLKTDDPAIKNIKYGDPQWAMLHIGTNVVLSRNLDPDTYSASELMYLGHTLMREQPDHHALNTHPLRAHIPLNTEGVLLMARARGFIDDHMLKTKTVDAIANTLNGFISAVFKTQLAEAQARIDLSTTQPITRREFAINTLLAKDLDPDEDVTLRRRTHTVGGAHEYGDEQKSLLEYYLDQHLNGFQYTGRFATTETRKKFSRMPDLPSAYKRDFDATQNKIEKYLANFLTANLELHFGQELKHTNTTLTLKAIKMHYGFNAHNEQHHPVDEYVQGKGGLFIEVNTPTKGLQRFVFIHKESDKGLQALPANMTAAAWAENRSYIEKIFTPAEREHAIAEHDYKMQLRQTVLANHTGKQLTALTAAAAKRYGKDHIASLYDTYYEPSARERVHDIASSIAIPFYDLPKIIREWSDMTAAQKQDAITMLGIEILGFLPAIGEGAKLLKTLGKTAAFSMRATVQKTSHTMASLAKEAAKLPKRGFKFAYELGDAMMPIGLPSGSGKTSALRHAEQTRIATELKPYPNLANIFGSTTQQVKHGKGYWVADDLSKIMTDGSASTYAVKEKSYRVALSDGQPILFAASTDGIQAPHSFIRVNPLTDQAESLPVIMHISTENKVYTNAKTAQTLLHDYRIPHRHHEMQIDRQLAAKTGAQHTYRDRLHGYHTIRIDDGKGPFYRIRQDDNALFHIVHPHDHSKKMPVEVINGQWQLIFDPIPKEFHQLELGATRAWQHPLSGDELTVTRLADENRIVLLKAEGGKYREIDWASGKPQQQRHLIFKDTAGIYHYGKLKGGQLKDFSQPTSLTIPLDNIQIERLEDGGTKYCINLFIDDESFFADVIFDAHHGVWKELKTQNPVGFTEAGQWEQMSLERAKALSKLKTPTLTTTFTLLPIPKVPADIRPLPKQIYHIWLGGPMPEELINNVIANSKKWAGYQSIVYMDLNEPGLFEHIQDMFVDSHVELRKLADTEFFNQFKETNNYQHYTAFRHGDNHNYAAAADALRYPLINHHGGIYMDIDDKIEGAISSSSVLSAAPHDVLLKNPVAANTFVDEGFNNNIFASHSNNPLLNKISEEGYRRFIQNRDYLNQPRPFMRQNSPAEMHAYMKKISEIGGPKLLNDVLKQENPVYQQLLELNKLRESEITNNLSALDLLARCKERSTYQLTLSALPDDYTNAIHTSVSYYQPFSQPAWYVEIGKANSWLHTR